MDALLAEASFGITELKKNPSAIIRNDGSVQPQFLKVLKRRLEEPRIARSALVGMPDGYKIKLPELGYQLAHTGLMAKRLLSLYSLPANESTVKSMALPEIASPARTGFGERRRNDDAAELPAGIQGTYGEVAKSTH